MKKDISHILEKLTNEGGRTTPIRRAILECLLEFDSPTSVPQLMERLKRKKFSPNKTTIYRQLSTLLEHKVIEMIKLDADTQLFEIAKGHHHHFVCDDCEKVIDIESPEVESALHAFEKELEHRNLRVTKHEFALYGLCSTCS